MKTFPNWDTEIYGWDEIASRATELRSDQPVQLTLTRHGQTTANAEHLITGASDPPLTKKGLAQAETIRTRLTGPYDAAIHSDLRRSRETLEAAVNGLEVGTILADPRLAERSMGVLEGKPSRPLPAYDRGDLFWAPEGGENYGAVTQRAVSFLLDLLALAPRTEGSLRIFAASHVGTMRILSGIVERAQSSIAVLTRQFDNAAVLELSFRRITWPAFLNPAEVAQ
jgi:broad specificity phosphatase PhoE